MCARACGTAAPGNAAIKRVSAEWKCLYMAYEITHRLSSSQNQTIERLTDWLWTDSVPDWWIGYMSDSAGYMSDSVR